jgi:hypothetical protein
MQDKQLFEYAVIRVVPMVEREEFMNVGVVLYCAGQKFLQALFSIDEQRLRALSDGIDIQELQSYLHAFQRICDGDKDAGPISKLPLPERFRWLTATRSTIVQTSKVHPGLCTDATEMLQKLYEQLVVKCG